MKKFLLPIMGLFICPLQTLKADSTREELDRLRALSQRVELQLPSDARARLVEQSPEVEWQEDSISVGQAAPSRSPAQPERPLVQEDLELESSILESFEYQPHQEKPVPNRRTRSR
jgi:hypothetical protein